MRGVNMIVCYDANYGIGYGDKLLFNIDEDKKFFKEQTMGGVVIMGKNTYCSLPLPHFLKGRTNVILSSSMDVNPYPSNPEYQPVILNHIEDVIETYIKPAGDIENIDKPIWIIGGSQIYKEFLPYCDNIYATEIDYECKRVNKYFPKEFKKEFTCSATLQMFRKQISIEGKSTYVTCKFMRYHK